MHLFQAKRPRSLISSLFTVDVERTRNKILAAVTRVGLFTGEEEQDVATQHFLHDSAVKELKKEIRVLQRNLHRPSTAE